MKFLPYPIPRAILAFLLLRAIIPAVLHAQNYQLHSETKFVIDGAIDESVILSVPYRIQSFSEGTFILQQGRDLELRLFDPAGKYLRGMGGRGRGPFEFLDISYFFINPDDRLVVFDNHQAKISIFNKKGGLREQKTPFANRPHIRSVHPLSDGTYLIGVTRFDLNNTRQEGKLFFLMKEDYTVTDSGFVHRSSLHNEDPGSVPDLVMAGGPITDSSILTIHDDLVIAPKFYTGEILVFRRSSNYSKAETVSTQPYGTAYREYKGDLPGNFRQAADLALYGASGPRGRALYFLFNNSKGLFRLQSGHIIHFIQDWDEKEEKAHLWMELFNEDATQLLMIQEIEELGDLRIRDHVRKAKYYSLIELHLLHMDGNDNLYIRSSNSQNEPELHVVTLSLSQN